MRGAELLAWGDGRRLIARERDPDVAAYRPRPVPVTLGSDETVPLSGFQEETATFPEQTWRPVFARR
ncbi:hypothetical protein ACFRI7_28225 [Streptomyces sp. NPDC056716]|uniref:hypothetical protein n=1 Tax=unclassified Streptomyces TaxID=2593676 RepID=UPI0036918988